MKHKLFITLSLVLLVSCSYLPTIPDPHYTGMIISETEDYIELMPSDSVHTDAILFIPGGLVDPHAYIPSMERFCTRLHLLVVIPKVRSNLAILNPQSVKRVVKQFDGYRWIIGGHSLGGVLASQCVHENNSEWEALFFLGSYSTLDLSRYPSPVISIRGSEDKLTTANDWDKYEKNLPTATHINSISSLPTVSTRNQTVYFTIDGGNHAQMGQYGIQKNDGEATITADEQHEQVYNVISEILRTNGFKI